jgi:Holliday junction resolvasome RuvABC endonuclease subunit
MTQALGLKCTKDTLDWAVLEGDNRHSATVLNSKRVTAPVGDRGQQLVWIRREIQELLQKYAVNEAVLRAVEPGGQGNSLPRAEVEGVVQEAVAAMGIPCRRVVSVSMRSAFGAKNGAQLQEAVMAVSVVAATAKTRQDPVTAALVAFAE